MKLILLAASCHAIKTPPPPAGELQLQVERVRGAFDVLGGAFDLLGRELARLEEMVPGR